MSRGSAAVEDRELVVDGERVAYRLHRSARRTLEITVAAGGVVEVRAPAGPTIERIEQRLRARSDWIRRKVAHRSSLPACEPPREFVSGAAHRYLGRQYRLRVVAADRPRVRATGGRLVVEVPRPSDREYVRKALARWVRQRAGVVLRARVESLTSQPAFAGLHPAAVLVRTMQTRWGSCSSGGRLLLNARLIELPASLIDYVIAHELCHLRVAKHGVRFERLLTRLMPDWSERHQCLNDVTS